MKLSLGLVLITATISIGCISRPVNYSHTENYDFMTTESRGNNLEDYNFLRLKAEEMCHSQGNKYGVEILDARAGASHGETTSVYCMAYRCKDPSLTERVKEVYSKVEAAVK